MKSVILKDRNLSKIHKTKCNALSLLFNNYNISLSHMYIRRNLTNITEYVLQDGILIKKLW